MLPGCQARRLAMLLLLLLLPAAGCFQQIDVMPRGMTMETLPARRSDVATLAVTSALPITVIAPTPLRGPPVTLLAPAVAAAGEAFITPRSPDSPSMAEGESSGFTTFSLPTPTSTPRPPGVDEVSPECVHTVLGGDTVYGIALQHGTTVADMRAANPSLKGDNPVIRPGQQLVIAGCADLPPDDQVAPRSAVVTPAPAIVATDLPAGFRLHVVRSSESLYSIALNYGLAIQDLTDANELLDPDRLDVGQEILIPPG